MLLSWRQGAADNAAAAGVRQNRVLQKVRDSRSSCCRRVRQSPVYSKIRVLPEVEFRGIMEGSGGLGFVCI